MAEGDGAIYNNFKEQVMEGVFQLQTGGHSIKVGLLTGYSPNIDTHTVWADVSASECSGTGYSAGGSILAGQDTTQDNTNDLGLFDATDLSWTSLSCGTPSHAVMYDDTAASDELIAYWEVTTVTNGGNYTLQWNASGIITLT